MGVLDWVMIIVGVLLAVLVVAAVAAFLHMWSYRHLNTFFGAQSFEEMKLVLKQHPRLLSPAANFYLQILVSQQPDKSLQLEWAGRTALLLRSRAVGIDQAFADYSRLQNLLLLYIETEDRHEKRQLIQAHPQLLDPEVDIWMKGYITLEADRMYKQRMEMHRVLLERCRAVGVDHAFRDFQEL